MTHTVEKIHNHIPWFTGKDLVFSPEGKHDLPFPPRLPLLVYGYSFTPYYHLTPNYHDYLEVCHVVDGSGIFSVEEQQIEAASGDTIVVNNTEFHLVDAGPRQDLKVACVFFLPELVYQPGAHLAHQRFLTPFLNRPPGFGNLIPSSAPQSPAIGGAILGLSHALPDDTPHRDTAVIQQLLHLLHTICLTCPDVPVNTTADSRAAANIARLEPVFSVIHTGYDRRITQQELATAACMSSSYLARLFRKVTGITISEYIMRYRVDRAKELLAQRPELSVSQVAYAVGFASHSYFDRTFSRFVHMSPQAFRTRCSGET